MIRLLAGNSVPDWQNWILHFLEQKPGKRASLLILMQAAQLHSRHIKHPFNDALTILMEDKRVMWQSLPDQPIRIMVTEGSAVNAKMTA